MINETRSHETCVKIDHHDFISGILSDLKERRIQSLIVEGGPKTLEEFVAQNLWDEVRMFVAPTRFGNGLPAPRPVGQSRETEIGGDRLITMFPG